MKLTFNSKMGGFCFHIDSVLCATDKLSYNVFVCQEEDSDQVNKYSITHTITIKGDLSTDALFIQLYLIVNAHF